jgi:hypothetical protein
MPDGTEGDQSTAIKIGSLMVGEGGCAAPSRQKRPVGGFQTSEARQIFAIRGRAVDLGNDAGAEYEGSK